MLCNQCKQWLPNSKIFQSQKKTFFKVLAFFSPHLTFLKWYFVSFNCQGTLLPKNFVWFEWFSPIFEHLKHLKVRFLKVFCKSHFFGSISELTVRFRAKLYKTQTFSHWNSSRIDPKIFQIGQFFCSLFLAIALFPGRFLAERLILKQSCIK